MTHWGSVSEAAASMGIAVVAMPGLPIHAGRLGQQQYISTDPAIPPRGLRRQMVTALALAVLARVPLAQRPRDPNRWCRRFGDRVLARVREHAEGVEL